MLAGLTQAEYVIMDAGYDSDDLREFIYNELGAVAQIKCNPTRSVTHPIDWHLYKEHHLIECFFNRITASAASPCDARRPSACSRPSLTSFMP